MKQLLALAFGLLSSIATYADCLTKMLWVFPDGPAIKQNSIFVLYGMGQSEPVILGLNKTYSIYLKSGETKVRLQVTETHVGQYGQAQALLKPETALAPGQEYALCIDSLPEYEYPGRYNPSTERYEPVTYKVLAEKDTVPPKLVSQPRVLRKTLAHDGCGPATHVLFSNPAKDDPDVIVRTTVVALKTGRETTYYLQPYGPHGAVIQVGHDMCSGAFTFEEGDDYEVSFSFMDASGNMISREGERIKFTKPVKDTGFDE